MSSKPVYPEPALPKLAPPLHVQPPRYKTTFLLSYLPMTSYTSSVRASDLSSTARASLAQHSSSFWRVRAACVRCSWPSGTTRPVMPFLPLVPDLAKPALRAEAEGGVCRER